MKPITLWERMGLWWTSRASTPMAGMRSACGVFDSRPSRLTFLIWIGGAFCVGLAGYLNIGFVAMDDYSQVVRYVIPFQHHSVSEAIATSGIRSPVPVLFLRELLHPFAALGMESPVLQLRTLLVLLGLGSFTTLFVVAGWPKALPPSLVFPFRCLAFLFVLMPFVSTRPMYEALSTPWFFLSCASVSIYTQKKKVPWILFALFTLTVASVLRPQCGIALPVLVFSVLALPSQAERGKHLVWVLGAALALFLLTGFLDLWLKGSFHASLKNYVVENYEISSTYGKTSPLMAIALLLGLTLPPTFFSRYSGFAWKQAYGVLWPYWGYAGIFFLAHAVIPHKEERFFIPMIPLLLVLFIPALRFFWSHSGMRWRVYYFWSVNSLLWIPASYFVAQNNVIGLVQYLNHHPEIKSVKIVSDKYLMVPEVLLACSVSLQQTLAQWPTGPGTCDTLVVTQPHKLRLRGKGYAQVAAAYPNILEQFMVWANPGQNLRRAATLAFLPQRCLQNQD